MIENPTPYSLEWIKLYRKDGLSKMQSVSKGDKSSAFSKLIKKLSRLEKKLSLLFKELKETCPHALEDLRYSESSKEDTLGCRRPGLYYNIICSVCKRYLMDWSDNK